MNAKQAWALLATGVLSYEFYCKDGELLSECVDVAGIPADTDSGDHRCPCIPSGKCAAGAV